MIEPRKGVVEKADGVEKPEGKIAYNEIGRSMQLLLGQRAWHVIKESR